MSGSLYEQTVRSLSVPDAYPHHVDDVEVRESDVSALFLAGPRAYELKRPVSLDGLDYREVEFRQRACEEQVRISRRISPRMSLRVLPVTRTHDGEIQVDGKGEAIDWLVERTRLPAKGMLAAMLARDEVGDEDLDRVALELARFHRRAMTGPSVNRHALADAVRSRFVDVVERLASVARETPSVASEVFVDFLIERARGVADERRGFLERRIADWRIREGHGDLHAGNVCLVSKEVFVFDCLEYDRRLRCADVGSDLASLVVDLEQRGRAPAAERLVRAYAEASGDAELPDAVRLYRSHRALLRASGVLGAARASRGGAPGVEEARRYVHLAIGYELPSVLVLVGGRPCDVRARTARRAADRLRADLIEARGAEAGGETVASVAHALEAGRSVVVDGAPPRSDEETRMRDVAARLGIDVEGLVLVEEPSTSTGESPLRCAADAEPEAHVEALLEHRLRA